MAFVLDMVGFFESIVKTVGGASNAAKNCQKLPETAQKLLH